MYNSRQIRPPIYSLKQSKLRKRRVVRYAILYFLMFFVFLILIIGPAIAAKFIGDTITGSISNGDIFYLMQPAGLNNNDTSSTPTGKTINGGNAGAAPSGSAAAGGGGGQASYSWSSSLSRRTAAPMFVYDYYTDNHLYHQQTSTSPTRRIMRGCNSSFKRHCITMAFPQFTIQPQFWFERS